MINKEKGFEFLGDLVSPHILFMGNENKVGFDILGDEMVFEFLGVFNTLYPTPRPRIVNQENDFENGILAIPIVIFNNNFFKNRRRRM